MSGALIIFVRNPVLGKVKTRLAETMGDEKALAVYQFLLAHTKRIIEKIEAEKFIFYADFINQHDLWDGCYKKLQQGSDLGERMENAFETVLELGFKKVCIIGSDCYELNTAIIADAFESLDAFATAIGPANDGGYYLLGMQAPMKNVFKNISWSTEQVFAQTEKLIKHQQYSLHILPSLNDVDEEDDINFIF